MSTCLFALVAFGRSESRLATHTTVPIAMTYSAEEAFVSSSIDHRKVIQQQWRSISTEGPIVLQMCMLFATLAIETPPWCFAPSVDATIAAFSASKKAWKLARS